MYYPTLKIPTIRFKGSWTIPLLWMALSCNRSTYPCPDIHGGTEVVNEGSTEGLKKSNPNLDGNGRLVKKPYAHSKMKRKRKT